MKNSLKRFEKFRISIPFQFSIRGRGGDFTGCLTPCFDGCSGESGWDYTDCMNSCIDDVLPDGGPCPESLAG